MTQANVNIFQHIILAFDLTWKDIMVIFSQSYLTLSKLGS